MQTIFDNVSTSLHESSHDHPILDNRGFDNFILADELFVKAL